MGNSCETYCAQQYFDDAEQLNTINKRGEMPMQQNVYFEPDVSLQKQYINTTQYSSAGPPMHPNSTMGVSALSAKRVSKKTYFYQKNFKSPQEKSTYWLRGMGPSSRSTSPLRPSLHRTPPKVHIEPIEESIMSYRSHNNYKSQKIEQVNIVQIRPDTPPNVVEESKSIDFQILVHKPPKRQRNKRNRGKFPFEYIHNVETDQVQYENYLFSQKLSVFPDKPSAGRKSSPNRDYQSMGGLTHEERISQLLNNSAMDFCLKAPQLANEVIQTIKPKKVEVPIIPKIQEKRLKFKDAQMQSDNQMQEFKGIQTDDSNLEHSKLLRSRQTVNKSTDVSTITDITPPKLVKHEQPQTVINEEIITPRKIKKPKKQEQQQIKKQPTIGRQGTKVDYQVQEIVIDPDEEMITEGDMAKFKPGIERNFITRWLQLSTRSFRYYKNHYHSICYLTRPIAAIPLTAIEKVLKFEIQNNEYKRRDKELYSFMYEIVLRQDYEDIYFFREFEVNGINNTSPGRDPSPLGQHYTVYNSGRQRSTSDKSKNSSPSSLLKKSFKRSLIESAQVDSNGQIIAHKFVMLSNRKSQSPTPTGGYHHHHDSSVMTQNHAYHKNVTRIIQGHLMPIRDQNKGINKEHYLEDQNQLQKEFGEPLIMPNGSKQIHTWANRQSEWYNSERRFIFACKSEQERRHWMKLIKDAVKANNNRLRQEALQASQGTIQEEKHYQNHNFNSNTTNSSQFNTINGNQMSAKPKKQQKQQLSNIKSNITLRGAKTNRKLNKNLMIDNEVSSRSVIEIQVAQTTMNHHDSEYQKDKDFYYKNQARGMVKTSRNAYQKDTINSRSRTSIMSKERSQTRFKY